MRVERFLANAQLLRQIIHGHTAESVTEKVDPRGIDNSLPVRIALSASRPRFVCPFHIHHSTSTNAETNPVYLVSEAAIREYLDAYCAGDSVQKRGLVTVPGTSWSEVITTFGIDQIPSRRASKLLDYAISPAD